MREVQYSDGGLEQEVEEALLIHLKLAGGTDASEQDRQLHTRLLDQLRDVLSEDGIGELGSDETSGEFRHLVLYGPSAAGLERVVLPLLRTETLPAGSYVAKRYGEVGAREERVEL